MREIYKDPLSDKLYYKQGRFSLQFEPTTNRWSVMWWEHPRPIRGTAVTVEPNVAMLLGEAWISFRRELSESATAVISATSNEIAAGHVGVKWSPDATMMVKGEPFLLREGVAPSEEVTALFKQFVTERLEEFDGDEAT